jgi:hypothetical protein
MRRGSDLVVELGTIQKARVLQHMRDREADRKSRVSPPGSMTISPANR